MQRQRSEPRDSDQLEQRFHRLVRRLRIRAAFAAAARWLPLLQLIWSALFVAWRLGWTKLSPFAAEVLGTAAVIFLATVVVAAARSPRSQSAALLADRRLDTRELLTAAHETDPGDRHPLARQVRRRALAALDPDRIRAAFPWTRPAAWRRAALGLFALAVAVFIPHAPEVAAAVPVDPVVTATAEALEQELEELADQLDLAARPETEDAFQRLEELVEELRQGEVPTVEEALIELASFEETVLSSPLDAATAAPDGLDELISEFAAEPLGAELAEAMTTGDVEALRQALRGLADSLPSSAAEAAQRQQNLQSLAQRFEDLADELDDAGRWAEAALLRQLAEALRDGDFERARELLGSSDLAGACRLGGRPGAGVAGELGDLVQLARHLLGVGLPKALAEGGSGESGVPGRGPHPGTDSTNTEGEGYATGDPVVRHRQSEVTSDRTGAFERLYEPRLLEPGATEDVRTSGQVGEAGEMLSREGRGAGVEGPASLPLRPFSSAAPGAPEQATDLESVPLGYRHLVRDYFERSPPPDPDPRGDPP